MALRADSYSSEAEVTAFTRHLLDGNSAFNSTTRPTITELDKFIDRASGVLNIALNEAGFSPTAVVANSTAKLLCDEFVTEQAVMYVELTQRGTGYSETQGSRTVVFAGMSGIGKNLSTKAQAFVQANKLGLYRAGVAQAHPMSEGLTFTGLGDQADRPDTTDDTLEQPMFRRRQFDFPKGSEGQEIGGSDTGDMDA